MNFLKKLLLGIFLAGSVALAAPAQKDVKEWTVYIHMNGDNNLCPYASKNLKDIESKDVSAVANIIVAFDCNRQGDSKMITIANGKTTISNKGEYDMGDWQFLLANANKAFDQFPSKHRMIDIWNHGAGWKMRAHHITKGISYDDQSGNHITAEQIGYIVDGLKLPVDIMGYDACLMQMVEIAYELDPSKIMYMLGSEETEPGDGWNYKTMIQELSIKADPVSFGKAMVDGYISQYTNEGVTHSFIEMDRVADLVVALDGLAKEYISRPDEVKTAMNQTVGYAYADYKDIGNFIKILNPANKDELLEKLSAVVVYNKNTMNSDGLSIYLTANPLESYKDLKFGKQTSWFDMLAAIK